MEMVGGYHAGTQGEDNLMYNMISTVEEAMEMAGLVIFVQALLHFVARNGQDCDLRIRP